MPSPVKKQGSAHWLTKGTDHSFITLLDTETGTSSRVHLGDGSVAAFRET